MNIAHLRRELHDGKYVLVGTVVGDKELRDGDRLYLHTCDDPRHAFREKCYALDKIYPVKLNTKVSHEVF